jgi:hypothetical protein
MGNVKVAIGTTYGCLEGLGECVHNQLLTATAAGLAPAACHHSSVRGHATTAGEDALSGVHAAHVLGGRLLAAQDDSLTLSLLRLSLICNKKPTRETMPFTDRRGGYLLI